MSISISPASLLAGEPYLAATTAIVPVASTVQSAAVASTLTVVSNPATAVAATATSPLVQDIALLLQALASGNLSAAQTALGKVNGDLKAEENQAASASSAMSSSSDHPSPSTSTGLSAHSLEDLMSKISTSLSSGNTGGALLEIAGFLVQNGKAIGNLINTTV